MTNFQEEAVNDGPFPPSSNSFCCLRDSVEDPDLALLAFSPFSRAGLLLVAGRLLGIDALYGHRTTGLGAGRDLTHSSGLGAFLKSQAPFETVTNVPAQVFPPFVEGCEHLTKSCGEPTPVMEFSLPHHPLLQA